MIAHRARRDIRRCRRKYGDAWTQYEKEVPYLFIPVSPIVTIVMQRGMSRKANTSKVCLLRRGFDAHGLHRHLFC